jgi:NarL family two-component system response regulator LiaR
LNETVRVVIVDDHAVITDGLSNLLTLHPGIEVVGTANAGGSAVAVCGDLRPDVVLMDMSMPGMNGAEATQRILSEIPTARVIILTSFVDRRMVNDAMAAGASGYLLKSIGGTDLAQAIRSAAQGRATLSVEALAHLTTNGPSESTLTERELDVLRGLSDGKTNKQIAADLSLSPGTIRVHVSKILAKLGVENRTAAARYALHHGLGGRGRD